MMCVTITMQLIIFNLKGTQCLLITISNCFIDNNLRITKIPLNYVYIQSSSLSSSVIYRTISQQGGYMIRFTILVHGRSDGNKQSSLLKVDHTEDTPSTPYLSAYHRQF